MIRFARYALVNSITRRTCSSEKITKFKPEEKVTSLNDNKYRVFRDEDAPVIYDIEEERDLHEKMKSIESPESTQDEFRRGLTGVFDIEELVDLLRKDNAEDLCVIRFPPELKYVDFIVVATGRSKRHIFGLAEFVRRIYKKKRYASDDIPRIEGGIKSDWIALDLGNIALHIMSDRSRARYDLESLWSVGAEFDVNLNEPEDSILELLKKHSLSLDGFQPLNQTINT